MTVKTLLDFLKGSNPKDEVFLSKDAEGNHYSPLNLVQEAYFVSDKTKTWDVECQNDRFKGSKKCILLWPSN